MFKLSKAKIIRFIGSLLGALIFFYTIKVYGFLNIWNVLKELKFAYLLILINSFAWVLLYTLAWRPLLGKAGKMISYLELLRIKLAGEGINFMTPLGFIAGDPVRVLMLKKYLGPEAKLHSVVIDRLMHTLAAQVFCFLGILLLFTQPVAFPSGLIWLMVLTYIILITALVSLISSLVTGHGFGIFEPLMHLDIIKRFPAVYGRILEFKGHLEFYQDRSKLPFWISFSYHFLGRVLTAVEIMIVFYCFEGRVDVVFTVILMALTSFFSVIFGFIPGALGVLESLYANFFVLYGFRPEVGLSIQLVRRLRVIFWIVIGVIVLDYNELSGFFARLKKKNTHE